MIPDKHPETSDSPSLPRRSGGAVTAPLRAFHLPLTLCLLISSIISPIWCPGRGKVGRRRPQFQSFNLTACGATAVSARCKYAHFLSLMSVYVNEAAVRRLDLAPPLSEGAARPHAALSAPLLAPPTRGPLALTGPNICDVLDQFGASALSPVTTASSPDMQIGSNGSWRRMD